MGQEIGKTRFSASEFRQFSRRLAEETALLAHLLDEEQFSSQGPVTGFELEAWLVDGNMEPAPENAAFLAAFASPFACAELAKFNVEFNNSPRHLRGRVLSDLHADLHRTWSTAAAVAQGLALDLLAIGILPTLREAMLNLGNLSVMNRFRALNEQILAGRKQQPITLEISGHEHFRSTHGDVMLEAAATSFQIHLQVPLARVRDYFNASVLASAPLVGVAANSPFLFGRDLWAETRIPVFEQAIAAGGYEDASQGPLHRVSFGTGYARYSLAELFEENLRHFPVLLPILSKTKPEEFAHLRLHNGTVWRWNRPLVGFDPDGTPHLRIEQRVVPAGPSIADMIANAALFFGLVESFVTEQEERKIPFPEARDNFYQAAHHGLNAQIVGPDGAKQRLKARLLHEWLPLAAAGLRRLKLDEADIGTYLGIIEQRASSGQTGSEWQRRFIEKHPGEFSRMTREYLNHQKTGEPVHQWTV